MFPLKPKKASPSSGKTRNAEAHTSPTKYGMGFNYGSGRKNPIGKMRDTSVGYRPVKPRQMRKPPKSVV